MKYEKFISNKLHLFGKYGFKATYVPAMLYDFQKFVVNYMLLKGRCAGFIDTGLGKTFIELVLAMNVVKKTNKPVLILTPLAVAFQFLKEAELLQIDDIEYSKNGKFTKKIVISNYERLKNFNSSDFEAVILDESSILKNFDGSIKAQVTNFMKLIKYRFLLTATPSPNDFIELGTSSEALGVMGYVDMLTTYFTNNENTIKPHDIGTKWHLKSHAEDDFFKWVSSWSASMRKPSDLGFSDDKFILPELHTNVHKVRNPSLHKKGGQFCLLPRNAKTFSEIRQEQKETINKRCEKAVELSSKYDTSVYWCNLMQKVRYCMN